MEHNGESLTVIIWLAGLLVASVVGLFSGCVHILISIYRTVGAIDKRDSIREERYEAVRRHTARNQAEIDALNAWKAAHPGKVPA